MTVREQQAAAREEALDSRQKIIESREMVLVADHNHQFAAAEGETPNLEAEMGEPCLMKTTGKRSSEEGEGEAWQGAPPRKRRKKRGRRGR